MYDTYKNMRKRSNILLHGVVHAVDQGNDAHQQEQPFGTFPKIHPFWKG